MTAPADFWELEQEDITPPWWRLQDGWACGPSAEGRFHPGWITALDYEEVVWRTWCCVFKHYEVQDLDTVVWPKKPDDWRERISLAKAAWAACQKAARQALATATPAPPPPAPVQGYQPVELQPGGESGGTVTVGDRVRVVRGAWAGRLGTVLGTVVAIEADYLAPNCVYVVFDIADHKTGFSLPTSEIEVEESWAACQKALRALATATPAQLQPGGEYSLSSAQLSESGGTVTVGDRVRVVHGAWASRRRMVLGTVVAIQFDYLDAEYVHVVLDGNDHKTGFSLPTSEIEVVQPTGDCGDRPDA